MDYFGKCNFVKSLKVKPSVVCFEIVIGDKVCSGNPCLCTFTESECKLGCRWNKLESSDSLKKNGCLESENIRREMNLEIENFPLGFLLGG